MKVVLRRVRPGRYETPDGRFTVAEAFDSSAVTRGRGPRYWVLSDTSGRSGSPGFVGTLAEARVRIAGVLTRTP